MITKHEPRSIAPTIHKQATDTKVDQSHQTRQNIISTDILIGAIEIDRFTCAIGDRNIL
jgi:hypothetical protein